MPNRELKRKDLPELLSILRRTYKDNTMLASIGHETPFQVLIATVLSARSRDEVTLLVARELFRAYGTPDALARAPIERLEKLVRRIGFYHVKAKRIKDIACIIRDKYAGIVPDDMDALISIPGVGRKTAGCVLVYAFRKPAIPVDTHVHRVSNRLGIVATRLPFETERALTGLLPIDSWMLVNELFVLHGKKTCRPIGPLCTSCPVRKYCGRVGVT
jgi:endonuclease III